LGAYIIVRVLQA